jgi:hypothetical protein
VGGSIGEVERLDAPTAGEPEVGEDMDWLTDSFEEYTVAWILISSFVGGVVGASVKFLFEDILRPRLGTRRETRAVTRKYATPLVRSAEALERRINNLIRNRDRRWYEDSEYYRLSTLYAFAEHLSWIRMVEEEFGFLPFESSRKGREFNQRSNGIFRALSSFAYFGWSDEFEAIDASQVPRLMLTAVGEAMIDDDGTKPRRFTDFIVRFGTDEQFRRWFGDLDNFLGRACGGDNYAWDRLIAAGANLRAFVTFLDPKGSLVHRRAIVNLSLLAHSEVGRQLAQEFPDGAPKEVALAGPPSG